MIDSLRERERERQTDRQTDTLLEILFRVSELDDTKSISKPVSLFSFPPIRFWVG